MLLREAGIDALHVGDIGLASADDEIILDRGRRDRRIVVALDADFHAHVALSGAKQPSGIRVRIEGLRAEALSELLLTVLRKCAGDLRRGAVVSVNEMGVRVRRLPRKRSPRRRRRTR